MMEGEYSKVCCESAGIRFIYKKNILDVNVTDTFLTMLPNVASIAKSKETDKHLAGFNWHS